MIRTFASTLFALSLVAGCGDHETKPMDLGVRDAAFDGHFCSLPGSYVNQNGSRFVVAGGPAAPALDWLTLPDGFCAHYYGHVGNARQLRMAPSGELFVASPTKTTTGGGPGGKNAILVLPDDDHDGVADGNLTYLGSLPATQGLLFSNGYLYYQDNTSIRRVAYHPGDRQAPSTSELVATINVYTSDLHWPKVLDASDDGTIYVTNGGDQGEVCDPSRPFHGGILALDGTPNGKQITKGLRNPIALRCVAGKNSCFAAELALDYSANQGGREKILPVRPGDDWGYPCCATKNLAYPTVMPTPDCSAIVPETDSFIIGETPFGIEFDQAGQWPAPYTHALFVTLHGEFANWSGARLVAIATDPSTGAPTMASDLSGKNGISDFATGWDDGRMDHGRPAALTMAPDGRLFLSNDVNGDIFWIAPVSSEDVFDLGTSD